MSIEEIDQKLAAKWVKPNYLVPIGILPEGATQNTYIDLPGVATKPVNVRSYPLEKKPHILLAILKK